MERLVLDVTPARYCFTCSAGLAQADLYFCTYSAFRAPGPLQREATALVFDCQKEAVMVIICFESNVRHVANNVPKGTPSCKYRLRLSCLIQQLKALDEVIYPPPPDYSIYYLWKELEQKGERGGIMRESNFIEPKCTHMRSCHSFSC